MTPPWIKDPRLVIADVYLKGLADEIISGRLSGESSKNRWSATDEGWMVQFGGELLVPYDIVPRDLTLA